MKKLNAFICSCLATLLTLTAFGCANTNTSNDQTENVFSVNFIDVCYGDFTLITFKDGKNILIDCGNDTEVSKQNVKNCLNDNDVSHIDYLILTNVLSTKIGGALTVLENFSVGCAFIPDVLNKNLFPQFKDVYDKLVENDVLIKYSTNYQTIIGEDYNLMFLSPKDKYDMNGSYIDFNTSLSPTIEQICNISPIIYMQYKTHRFLFTGDDLSSQEQTVLTNYNLNLYNNDKLPLGKISLDDIDVYKASYHCSDKANCQEFLNLLRPKNVVISTSASNGVGTYALQRIVASNISCNIFRTDVVGNVCVVETDGALKISTSYL